MQCNEFLSLYASLESNLYAFATRLTRNKFDADDLLQETLIRAYMNREKFRPDTNFKAWISTIMRNTFTNKYHQQKRRAIIDSPLENNTEFIQTQTVANTSESNMMLEELIAIVESINEKYRIPFLMSYEGFEYQEISARLNIPVGTVKSRLYTARQQLKKMVTTHYHVASEY